MNKLDSPDLSGIIDPGAGDAVGVAYQGGGIAEVETHGRRLSLGTITFDRLLRDFAARVREGCYQAGADLVEERLDDMDGAAFVVAILRLFYAGKKLGASSADARRRAVGYAKVLLALRPDIPSAQAVMQEWNAN